MIYPGRPGFACRYSHENQNRPALCGTVTFYDLMLVILLSVIDVFYSACCT